MPPFKSPPNKAAARIRSFMEKRCISQRQLAFDLGLYPGSLGDYLLSRTEPSLRVAVMIDDYFKGEVPPRTWLEPV